MPRQPLMKMAKFAKGRSRGRPAFSIGSLSCIDKHDLTSLIGHALIAWSDVELQMGLLLAILMNAETEASVSVYLKLRRSVPRKEALEAAAKVSLAGRDYELFQAILRVHNQVEAERNALAHGIFGTTPDLPDCLLWVETEHATKVTLEFTDDGSAIRPPKRVDLDAFAKRLYVYSKRDLHIIHRDILRLYQTVLDFNNYLRIRDSSNSYWETPEQQYARLCNLPPIREALADLQRARALEATPLRRPRKSKPSLSVHGSNQRRRYS